MHTKLTLKLDRKVIEKAKQYAKSNQTSLSVLVETYFRSLAEKPQHEDLEFSPFVHELSGIIELPETFDLKKDYTDYLISKYK